MGDEILIGRNHVSEQDMQNALRGAFLEGFKEGVSVSQRSLFASTVIERMLRDFRDIPELKPEQLEQIGNIAFKVADVFVACSRPKKEANANPPLGH